MIEEYKCFVFDLDGTLIDSRYDIASSVNFCREYFKLKPMPDEEIISHIGHGVGELVEGCLPELDENKIDEASSLFNKIYYEHCLDKTKLFEGALDLVSFLNNSYPCVIFTNKARLFTDKVIRGLNLESYFQLILCGGDDVPKKPDKTGFDQIKKQFHCDEKDLLFFGDSRVDFETAQAACVDMAYYSQGLDSLEEDSLKKLKFNFSSYKDFMKQVSP